MSTVQTVLPWVQMLLAAALVTGVLLQQSGAGLGGAFGDNFSSGFHTRRGFEQTLFIGTLIVGTLFFVSACVALIL